MCRHDVGEPGAQVRGRVGDLQRALSPSLRSHGHQPGQTVRIHHGRGRAMQRESWRHVAPKLRGLPLNKVWYISIETGQKKR